MNKFKHVFQGLLLASSVLLFASTANANGLASDTSRNLVFAAFSGSVAVLNTSTPSSPSLVSDVIKTQGIVKDLFYDKPNKRLYVAADEGDLEIWDMQNPQSPQRISVTKVYYYNTETPVVSVAVVADIAFVSTSWGYMHRLDVSDPANPIDLGFNGIGGNPSRELVLGDDNTMVLAGPNTIQFNLDSNGNILSTIGAGHSTSYQVFRTNGTTYSSRSHLLKITGVNNIDTGNNINDIYAQGNLVFIAAANGGLRIWDLTDKNAPYVIGTDLSQSASSVIVNGHYAYVGFGPTVRVVDISSPSSPNVVGLFDATGGGLSNINPIANTSLSQSVQSGETVSLNGTFSSDPDGSIVAYSWRQVSGTPVTLANANTATPSFVALYDASQSRVVQQLNFELTVTDNDGATGSDNAQVSVGRSANGNGVINGGGSSGGNNIAPVADAGSDINATSRKKVWLNGRDSYDPDGSIVKYSWKQTSGKHVRLKRRNRSKAKFKAPKVKGSPIQLQFELTVTDNQGEKSTSTVNVTVSR